MRALEGTGTANVTDFKPFAIRNVRGHWAALFCFASVRAATLVDQTDAFTTGLAADHGRLAVKPIVAAQEPTTKVILWHLLIQILLH